jgi:hypothetical protein
MLAREAADWAERTERARRAYRSGKLYRNGLQLGTGRRRRSGGNDFLPQQPATFSAGKLALTLTVEARFISIES